MAGTVGQYQRNMHTGSQYQRFESVFNNVFGTVLLIALFEIAINARKFLLWLYLHTLASSRHIRITVAYLFRIKHNDKYLLVKNRRFPKYQPVGGVYKRYKSSKGAFDQLNIKVLDDDCLPIDESSRDDLRIRVRGRDVLKFIGWFNSMKDREVGHFREFHEELIETGVLRQDTFKNIHYSYLGREPIRLRKNILKKDEIKIFEIFELDPTHDQEREIEKLHEIGDTDYLIWATEKELIENRHVNPNNNDTEIALADNVAALLSF